MSQGYGYTPPTLDEAIKAYQRAKEKAKDVDNYSQRKKLNRSSNNLSSSQPILRARSKGKSLGSLSDAHHSDYHDEEDERRRLIHSRKYSGRKRRDLSTSRQSLVSNGAWTQGIPNNTFYDPQYSNIHYSNLHMPPALPSLQQYPAPYVSSIYQVPYSYPVAQPFIYPPVGTQYNIKHAEPMNHKDFQRDCKFSPAPSRPYSDSDLLENMSKNGIDDSDRFSVIPPIKKMDKSTAAKVIQKNYREYKDKKSVKTIKESFYTDFIDKLIDEHLTEELLPDLLVEVLLYGVRDIKLPNVTERVVCEYGDDIMDECVYEMLREAFNSVMGDMTLVYSQKQLDSKKVDSMNYMVDELISIQIRDVVHEFMDEYIKDYQCERIYNQLLYEALAGLVYGEVNSYNNSESEFSESYSRVPFDLDNVILASVLCKSLVPNEDYISDAIIAQSLANQLRRQSKI